MKLATALFAALVLASSASAQARAVNVLNGRQPAAKAEAARYGSAERRKLLDQARRTNRDTGVVIEGAVQRRALLTGTKVKLPKPKPHRFSQSRR